MVETRKYILAPTTRIPNSPYPLLFYPGLLAPEAQQSPNIAATTCHDRFTANGWETQWVFRYGQSQRAHYHSAVHECMVVLTGSARLRFGVGDTVDDLEENTYGGKSEEGGIEIDVKAGDVFVIPAGVAHKTYSARPEAEFKLLTPGEGHAVDADDKRRALAELDLDGFTMIGAYPVESQDWDFSTGGEHVGNFEQIWKTEKPARDPVMGDGENGLVSLWQ